MTVTYSLANASRLATPLLRQHGASWRRSYHNARGGWIAFTEAPPKRSANIPLFLSHSCSLARGYSDESAMGKTDCRVEAVIEIEKRFPFDGETVGRLTAAGASLISEKSFTDTYYDTPDFRLTGCDHWLRRRDGKWELKYPSPMRLSNNAAEYVENQDENAIDVVLAKLLEVPEAPSGYDAVSEPLSRWDSLVGFATFQTTRKKFSLNGVVIDLDSADFGFAIGEMEVLVIKTGNEEVDTENHQNALKALDETASMLGIRFTSNRMHGKVSAFMRQKRKEHYDFLVDRGIFKGESH